MNQNLDKSVNESFLDESSFDASLSDDDDSEEEEDDFVTAQEFKDFQDDAKKQIDELKDLCDKTIT